jgi:hypothetical protein
MCRRATCRACGKTTWAGCGAHVEQVLAGVPRDQRCTCTQEERAAATPPPFWKRWFGRGTEG